MALCRKYVIYVVLFCAIIRNRFIHCLDDDEDLMRNIRDESRQVTDYDKIYDVEVNPPFPVKANTLVNITINILDNRFFYPGEVFYLRYENEYCFRYEPLPEIADDLPSHYMFKPKRQLQNNNSATFEIEVKAIDHSMSLEVAVQRRDIDYPKVTPFFALQFHIYPHTHQLKMTTNVSNHILLKTVFEVKCQWKDYSAKIVFDAHDFKVVKLVDRDIWIKAILRAEQVGHNQMVFCHSNIDENNEIYVEQSLMFNVSKFQPNLNTTDMTYSTQLFKMIDCLKFGLASFLMIIIGIVLGIELYEVSNANIASKETYYLDKTKLLY